MRFVGTSSWAASVGAGADELGPNVVLFSPDMPLDEIQATLDATHALMVDDENGHAAARFRRPRASSCTTSRRST